MRTHKYEMRCLNKSVSVTREIPSPPCKSAHSQISENDTLWLLLAVHTDLSPPVYYQIGDILSRAYRLVEPTGHRGHYGDARTLRK